MTVKTKVTIGSVIIGAALGAALVIASGCSKGDSGDGGCESRCYENVVHNCNGTTLNCSAYEHFPEGTPLVCETYPGCVGLQCCHQ